uniref:Uncharacterized protein n=1 Tax=Caenorhabditis japonica TaxID=281687 RepID=A0A8R1I2B3_CAEJA
MPPATAEQKKKKCQDDFAIEASGILDELLLLIIETKNNAPKTIDEKNFWSEKWIEKVDDIGEKLDNFSIRLASAENCEKVDWRMNEPMTAGLIAVLNSMNQVTQQMYNIQNYFQTCKLMSIKKDMENHLEKLKAEEKVLQAKISEKQALIKEAEDKERIKRREEDEEVIRARGLKRAEEDIKKMLDEQAAIRALAGRTSYRNLNDEVNLTENDAETQTLEESTRTGRRRSRSIGRVVKRVKKTIRRSISAVNLYMENHSIPHILPHH